MSEKPIYRDKRSDFWKRIFEEALPYDEYLAASPEDMSARWKTMAGQIPELVADQRARVAGHNRRLNVLVYSGVWCGDCVRQGPMLRVIAEAVGREADLRFVERDASEELQEELRILGALRVPVAVFLSEDFHEIGRFGDRMLTVYRRKARSEPGPAAPSREELALEMEEWVAIFERALLMARLSPPLRERHGD
ncbi:MAG: thioredoxin family protein [Planctomycetota bacterium]|jgi:hypothetical protein